MEVRKFAVKFAVECGDEDYRLALEAVLEVSSHLGVLIA